MARVNKSTGPKGVVTPFPMKSARSMKPQAGVGRGSSDRVETTNAALELSRAREQVRLVSEALSPRVEELKAQIENGQYNPDPREIAKSILDGGFRP